MYVRYKEVKFFFKDQKWLKQQLLIYGLGCEDTDTVANGINGMNED